ncbi:MAG: flavodoxin reductase [Pseudomonadota bacterium]
MTHAITLLDVVPLTPDTRHYVFSKPRGFDFKPGQATDLALRKDGWSEEKRPFTFTSDPSADVISFTVKSYEGSDSMTAQMWDLRPGATVDIGDAWGAIENRGPGTFIAAGTGITPFIGILNQLEKEGQLTGSHLIYGNSTARDIILRAKWEEMEDLELDLLTDKGEDGTRAGRPDGETLAQLITSFDGTFYVCGPPDMTDGVVEFLSAKGVSSDRIVQEEG